MEEETIKLAISMKDERGEVVGCRCEEFEIGGWEGVDWRSSPIEGVLRV